ncbi:MAG: SCO family protein [Acidimicrobiia bacterium]|nr:SCO family protein [Acidimicrobiia bacterium]
MRIVLGVLLFLGTVTPPLAAQMTGAPTPGYRPMPGIPASTLPQALREIGFDQRLDAPLPLDATFQDEDGRTVQIGEYLGKKPAVLAFVYFDCPMLCTQIVNALAAALRPLSLTPGEEFDVVLVSFDPRETPALAKQKKAEAIARYGRPDTATGWHFLTGDEASIKRLTHAAGFRYVWDEETKQFAHPSGIIIVTPDGRPARYLFGIEYGPRDVRLALVEASAGRIGSPADQLLLFCYHYDPMTGRYGIVIMRVLRLAAIAIVLALVAYIVVMVRRERRTAHARVVPSTHFAPRPVHRN